MCEVSVYRIHCGLGRDWRSMLYAMRLEVHAMCTVHGDTQRVSWYLQNVCLASGRPELRAWETICVVLCAMWKRCAGMIVASVAVPCSVWNRPCCPCPSSETLRKQIRINRSRSELVAKKMFEPPPSPRSPPGAKPYTCLARSVAKLNIGYRDPLLRSQNISIIKNNLCRK